MFILSHSRYMLLLKLFSKKCVCVYVCMYVCLSFHTHMSKALETKSILYMRNEGYVLNLCTGELRFKLR